MSEDLHQIDDLFRSGLEGKEDAPSPKVWENIEAQLNEKERRPAAGFFGRKVAAALVILLGSAALFAAGYFIGGSSHHHNEEAPEIRNAVPRGGTGGNDANDTISSGEQFNTPVPEANVEGQAVEQAEAMAGANPTEQTKDETLRKGQMTGADGQTAVQTPGGTYNAPKVDTQSGNAMNNGSSPKGMGNRNGKKATYGVSAGYIANEGKTQAPLARDGSTDAVSTTNHVHAAEDASLTPMIHEAAEAMTAPGQHSLPSTARKLDTRAAKDASQTLPASAKAAIPVKDRKKGSLDLPAFTLTPVVAWQKNSVHVEGDGSRWGQEMKEGMERTEHTPARVSAGLMADVKASRNITIQTGLMLTQFDVHIDPKKVVAVKDIDGKIRYRFDCSAGTYFLNPKQGTYPRLGDTSTTRYSTNALNYINIPLNVKWHFGNSKLQFFAAAGAGMNFLLNQDLNAGLMHQYHYEGGRAANLKSSFFNGMIGAGMNYSISERIGLTLSPQYQFAITPMNENMPVKSLPRSFTVQAGLQIKLK